MFTGTQCCSILDQSVLDLRFGRDGNDQLDVVGSDCLVNQPTPTMLIGSELLAKVKELGDVGKSEIVRACGYVSTKKDGGERLNFTAFYEALLEAKGVELGGTSKVGKGGRKLSYVATVQGNGNLLIGKAYTAMLDLQPGDEFEIKLGRKQIRLIPVGGSDEDEE
jgi:AbrB-like transcriptional regulator